MKPNKTSLNKKFALIHEHWRPKTIAQLNGQELKLVKFAGVFPWHHHENEDELYRSEFVGAAKVVIVGMTSNDSTLAEPSDRGMLDVVGFDTTARQSSRTLSAMSGRFKDATEVAATRAEVNASARTLDF